MINYNNINQLDMQSIIQNRIYDIESIRNGMIDYIQKINSGMEDADHTIEECNIIIENLNRKIQSLLIEKEALTNQG